MPLSKLAALLDEWTEARSRHRAAGRGGGGETVVWSPVFNFYGGTPKRGGRGGRADQFCGVQENV